MTGRVQVPRRGLRRLRRSSDSGCRARPAWQVAAGGRTDRSPILCRSTHLCTPARITLRRVTTSRRNGTCTSQTTSEYYVRVSKKFSTTLPLFSRSHQNALASLPSIDDFSDPAPSLPAPPQPPPPVPPAPPQEEESRVDVMSDSSSSSSDSDSDSDRGGGPDATVIRRSNGHVPSPVAATNGQQRLPIPQHILNEDLCLSESGSDSDWCGERGL